MTTLFLEAFGYLSGPPTIDCEEEDLYSVFLTRSELMGWGAPSSKDRPLLWAMEEAEVTAGTDPHRIGFVQVGLGVGPLKEYKQDVPRRTSGPRAGWYGSPIRPSSTDPVLALPPLAQCFSDSLSRFGVTELASLQVTVLHMDADAVSQLGHLVSMLNWFNTNLETRAGAIVSFEQDLLGGNDVSELVTYLQRRNTGSFEFKSAVDVPEQHMVEVSTGEHFHPVKPLSDQGVSVIMHEWTPSAAGWVLASVINAARTIEPEPGSFAVRITRLTHP